MYGYFGGFKDIIRERRPNIRYDRVGQGQDMSRAAELEDGELRVRDSHSQSSETSVDSDAVDSIGSDEENSRVIAPQEIESSRPESSSTPRKAGANVHSRAQSLRELLNTQATQHVNPLTGSQLREVMGEDEDYQDAEETRDEMATNSLVPEGHSEHILSTSEGDDDDKHSDIESLRNGKLPVGSHYDTNMPATAALSLIESVASRASSRRESPPHNILNNGDVTTTKVGSVVQPLGSPTATHQIQTRHFADPTYANTGKAFSNQEAINSSPDNWHPLPIPTASSREQGAIRRGMNGGSIEVIEETPVKLLSMPSTLQSPFVFVLVKWTGSPHWWPARCNRTDWQETRPKARVLFRKNEFGNVDLRQTSIIYELKPDDMVHVMGKPAKTRFKVIACGVTTLPEGSISTNDGFNLIRLQNTTNENHEFSVDAEDIYLTKSDMQSWRSRRDSLKVTSDDGQTPDGERRGRSRAPQDSSVHIQPVSEDLLTPRSRSNTTTNSTTLNTTVPSATSKPPSGARLANGFATSGRDPLDTPTNNGSKRRSAGRSEIIESTSISPRKRRPRATNYHDESVESSPNTSPIASQEEDYNLKSSPLVSPVRRPRSSRHSRHYNDTSEESSSLAFNSEDNNTRSNKALFKNCIFSISTHDTQSVKRRAREILIDHGARVLDEGLSELVALTDISEEDSGSVPDHEYDFGTSEFAAVLADQPRRTSKYLEMVALGWPCLSITYMRDCVAQNKMLDWRPYLLPAGESNIIGKKMSVSLDTGAFYQRWIRHTPLNQQFNSRKVVFRCSVPLCIVANNDTFKSSLVLLASFCAPRFKLWFYNDKRDIPKGSILLDLKPTTNTSKETKRTDPSLLDQLQHYAAADTIVVKNTEWMIQSIINGGLV